MKCVGIRNEYVQLISEASEGNRHDIEKMSKLISVSFHYETSYYRIHSPDSIFLNKVEWEQQSALQVPESSFHQLLLIASLTSPFKCKVRSHIRLNLIIIHLLHFTLVV